MTSLRLPQRGFTLITALLLLIGLTLLGVAALRTSIFDEKAAGNVGFRSQAHQLAEGALRVAVTELKKTEVLRPPYTQPPFIIAAVPGGASSAFWKEDGNWSSTTSSPTSITGIPAAKQPRYTIEYLATDQSLGSSNTQMTFHWFRVTARAVDPVTGASVVLQQTQRIKAI